MRWALYVTLSPVWFDPGEVSGQLTPFWVLYAMHDALVKPMPGNLMAPSLAESWTLSADQRTYEFKLREGLKFHNGDPFTAEDVKFSFHRSKGSKILHDRVREVTVVSPSRVRFTLHRALAGLHGLLRHDGLRGRLDRAQEVRRAGGQRRLQEAPHRARALQVREPHARHRAGDGGQRELLAEDALGEAPGLQERAGVDDAPGHAQARRGRRGLPAGGAPGPGGQERSQPPAGLLRAASRRSSSISSSSGTPSRRGPTGGCGWPPTTRSTARRSARPRRSGPPSRPATTCRAPSSSRCRWSRTRTIPPRPSSCWPRPAIPTASTPASCTSCRRTSRSARRS